MLVEFSVENYRSCRDAQTVSLIADSGKEMNENTFVPEGVAGLEGRRLLKSLAIYGANASGKSNIVKAISFFFTFISRSATEREAKSPIEVTPFLLDTESQNKPTRFNAIFVIDKVVYEYGFSVNRSRVESEELIAYPKKMGRQLFRREVDEKGESHWQFSRTHFHRDRQLEPRTREDALFLSVAAQWNHQQLTPIYEWARGQNYLVFVDDQYRELMRQVTMEKCIEDGHFCSWITKMLKSADTGISGFTAQGKRI